MEFEPLDNEETEARIQELEMLIDDRSEKLRVLKEEMAFRQKTLY